MESTTAASACAVRCIDASPVSVSPAAQTWPWSRLVAKVALRLITTARVPFRDTGRIHERPEVVVFRIDAPNSLERSRTT